MAPYPFVPVFDEKMQRADLVPLIRAYVCELREEAAGRITSRATSDGERIGPWLAGRFDRLLERLFVWAAGRVSRGRGGQLEVSMAAVGSYGRRSLAYHSDLDVRLVTEDEKLAAGLADEILYPLWDAGVTIGHQVVTVGQVLDTAREDLATATSLLDWRPIAGDPRSAHKLDDKAFRTLFALGRVSHFLESLGRGADERVERYGESIYLLEPDIRNGPGGLRDFDAVHWTARARWRVQWPEELVRIGVLLEREWVAIEHAFEFISEVRNLIHVLGQRRNDRLSFDRQEQVAHTLGYGDDGPGVERFMSNYYRHARVLAQARETVALRAQIPPTKKPREQDLGQGLVLINGQLSWRGELERDPVAALRLYAEAVRRRVPVQPLTRTEISRATTLSSFCRELRQSPEAASLFVELLTAIPKSPCSHDSIVGELHDVGLLTALIPEFTPLVGRVHHDVYHVYTVDVHSLRAVDHLRALCRGELAEQFPIGSLVAAELARPRVLFFAVLLHDIGKDIGGETHSERGALLARSILARFPLSPEEISEIEHLIREHLTLYLVATRRDLEEPSTIHDFREKVQGLEGLRELYLLTLCDVGTTSPDSLTTWKARMIDELYLGVRQALLEEPENRERLTQALRTRVMGHFEGPERAAVASQFLLAMPERYLVGHREAELLEHTHFVVDGENQALRVGVVSRAPPLAELAVMAKDRPGLLALFAASIAAAGLSVVHAEVYSFIDHRGRRMAFDLFWIEAGERVRTGRTVAARVEKNLGRLLSGEVTSEDLVKGSRSPNRWVSRVAPKVSTRVNVENRGARDETIVEVITQDRPGLLFELADTLQRSQVVISRAKINTEGNQVADVFYVTDKGGGKLLDPLRVATLKANIEAAVTNFAAPGGNRG